MFGHVVLWGACQGEVVDVGGPAMGVGVGVVDFAEIAGHLAVGESAATVFGDKDGPLHVKQVGDGAPPQGTATNARSETAYQPG